MSSAVVTSSLLPERPRRGDREFRECCGVAQFLRYALPGNATFTHIPLGGQRHSRAAQKLSAMGTKAGWPDYIIIYAGRPIFIEMKTDTGALSAVQRQMRNKLIYCGANVVTCRSVLCVQESLLELGVPLKAMVSA